MTKPTDTSADGPAPAERAAPDRASSAAPVSGTPLSAASVPGTPVSAAPVSAASVPGTPASAAPVSGRRTQDAQAFLGVASSALGQRWVGPSPDTARLAEAIGQTTGLPPALCAVLARRGVAPADAAGFLEPTLRDLLPDPLSLRDMAPAAARFLRAALDGERIAIFADYDVDGGASAALLLVWLRAMGHGATLYVPDRIDEGYGPNVPAMEALAAAHDLIVCVDCGTLSDAPIAAAAAADVVVLDHHQGGERLPPALAVVNPNRQDEDGSLGHLCAAGVVFLLLVEVNRLLRTGGGQGPDLMAMLDLVALATVADVAPLIGVNRALVRQGLRVMARRDRPGLAALADVARMDRAPAAYHLGFLLGPRVNAGGRIGQADLGARLLATDDAREARDLAARLDLLNTERRSIEASVRTEALAQAEARAEASDSGGRSALAWAAGDGWHPGVVGIVAARLKEAMHRPAVVIGFDGNEGKGSGRSVAGVDLGASVHRLAAEGLIGRGGGHAMAAGLSLTRDQLEPAMTRLAELVARQGADGPGARDLHIDAALMPSALNAALIDGLEQAGPYGASAPAPRFALASQQVGGLRRIGEDHLRFSFGEGRAKLDGVAFGAFAGPLGPFLEQLSGRRVHLAGRAEINDWGGKRRVQLRLDDAALA